MNKYLSPLRFFILAFIASATLVSCSKTESPTDSGNNNNNGGTGDPAAEYYIEANVDGKDIRLEASTSDLSGIHMGNSISSSIGDTYFETQLTYFTKMIFTGQDFIEDLTVPSLELGLAKLYEWKPGKEEYALLLKKGTYPFGSHRNKVEGAVVSFRDTDGQFWSSELGWQNQQGSTFEITDFSETTDTPGMKETHFKIKAKFSCRVYNENGASKMISNGRASYLSIYY